MKGDKLLKGQNGNISISFDAKITPMSQTTALAEGSFAITGGTGDYANLQGDGETSATIDFAAGTLVGSYEGLVKGFK